MQRRYNYRRKLPHLQPDHKIFFVTLGTSPADAIHLASAAQAGTDLFLTNDKSLVGKIVPGIQFIAMLDTQIL
jgi:hypothetical protein